MAQVRQEKMTLHPDRTEINLRATEQRPLKGANDLWKQFNSPIHRAQFRSAGTSSLRGMGTNGITELNRNGAKLTL